MLKDLFYNVENKHLDLARVLAFGSWLAVVALAGWQVAQGKDVELDTFANAMLSVLIGSGAVIASKDISRSISIRKGGEDYFGGLGGYADSGNVRVED